jgi:hypothetical protein
MKYLSDIGIILYCMSKYYDFPMYLTIEQLNKPISET